MLVLGMHNDAARRPVSIPLDENTLKHTAVIGQSGSGKSYFISRYLEELLLRTKARVVILDPNGDFLRFDHSREDEFWTTGAFSQSLASLSSQVEDTYDNKSNFDKIWNTIPFQFITDGPTQIIETRTGVYRVPLIFHWKYLDSEQDFLLNVDPIIYPKIYQGIVTCYHYMRDYESDYPSQGYTLRDLENAAELFATRRIAVGNYPEAYSLNDEDWLSVRLQFRQLRKKFYKLWYRGTLKGRSTDSVATDLSGYIRAGFGSGFGDADPWRVGVIGLAASTVDDMLFTANATLYRIWKETQRAHAAAQKKEIQIISGAATEAAPSSSIDLEIREEDNHFMGSEGDDLDLDPENMEWDTEERVPTIIVIDEAQNFAPESPTSPIQARVSDKIAMIAAEGRKYGLFLLLATQRPQKLRAGLLQECENHCLLRIQSKLERLYASDALGVPKETVERVSSFDKGEALLTGRWVPGDSLPCSFAPARTVLGGGDLNRTYWQNT